MKSGLDLRYPIGTFESKGPVSAAQRGEWLESISALPGLVRQAVEGLTEEQLDTPYRPEGWTVRQVVHHLADSHMNSFIRFKLALTEEEPVIKPYEEQLWAELPDAKQLPVDISLRLLDSLHNRWTTLLHSLGESEWQRTLRHPASGMHTLEHMLGMYAWHGRHHTAQITGLLERNGWK
ncbi:YfiT family bacillithiol transferase [Paenibacillus gansuensis]|uniref:Putative metal-dependent hydrolase ACFSUF_10985 n=1 Tax=Paenibacillus gansuensis TaxID=306542 RepID=A0ABW5PDE7_9BACL